MHAAAVVILLAAGGAAACAGSTRDAAAPRPAHFEGPLANEQRACARACRVRWHAPGPRASCIATCAEMDVVDVDVDWKRAVGTVVIVTIAAGCE